MHVRCPHMRKGPPGSGLKRMRKAPPMCLAIPAQVTLVSELRMAQVDIHGVTRTVSLDLVPDADVGSWVLVHAGYAIEVVDEQFAAETWDLLCQMADAIDPQDAALLPGGEAPEVSAEGSESPSPVSAP